MGWEIINSRLEDWSRSYSGPKFHAVLCDPPYGLEFMGKEWDAPHKATSTPQAGNLGGFADGNKPSFARQKRHLHKLIHVYEQWGSAILPHLYPGAIVLMFGGTRTWHHLATGMEAAGFEMWDTLMWLYGQGFPKAQDISKLIDAKNGYEREVVKEVRVKSGGFEHVNRANFAQEYRPGDYQKGENVLDITAPSEASAPWAGYKTCALKPAWEPILAFRAPSKQTYAELATEFGSGCLNIDGARIATSEEISPFGSPRKSVGGLLNKTEIVREQWEQSPIGRYPANLILDEESAAMLDEQTGTLVSGNPMGIKAGGQLNCYGVYAGGVPVTGFGDSGGASRFFYVAKADSDEREAGLREAVVSDGRNTPADNPYQRGETLRRNSHPTVKPISLARWLAKLLLPPESVSPRRLLVPFSGSGSEIIGAIQAGWDEVLGIEQDTDHGYVEIAKARVTYWESIGFQKDLFQVGGIDARAE